MRSSTPDGLSPVHTSEVRPRFGFRHRRRTEIVPDWPRHRYRKTVAAVSPRLNRRADRPGLRQGRDHESRMRDEGKGEASLTGVANLTTAWDCNQVVRCVNVNRGSLPVSFFLQRLEYDGLPR